MNKEEFILSGKRERRFNFDGEVDGICYREEDIKEFISRLKKGLESIDNVWFPYCEVEEVVDALAGEELV